MRSKYCDFPLNCRLNSSDHKVFYQVFANLEYACFDDLDDVGLIVDCGANVGYTMAYFLTRHRSATAIAVEPDERNFEVLVANIAPFGDRVRPIRAGIWSHPCGLVVSAPSTGNEWGVQVHEAAVGQTPHLTAIDIPSLLRDSGYARVSILKIDIEGSEAVLLRGNCDWLDSVDNLAIELHGPECEGLFARAIEGRGFDVARSGELTICRRRKQRNGR
jgi:FkbM family methyltransferase